MTTEGNWIVTQGKRESCRSFSKSTVVQTDESGLYKKVASVERFIKGSQCMDYLSVKTKEVAVSGGSTVQGVPKVRSSTL